MRARIASALALTLLGGALSGGAILGCEGVPDLHFEAEADGGPSVTGQDATLPTTSPGQSDPGQPAPTGSDDAGSEDAGSVPSGSDDAGSSASPPPDDASGTPLPKDAATPPPKTDASPPDSGCPDNPPPGAVCCGSVACKGNAQQCNCGECAFCASEGYCCPSTHPAPGYCATELQGCH
jgi:hypothetical protein